MGEISELSLSGLMTRDEAEASLARMAGHRRAFWLELKEFHARKGWLALGYATFKACVEERLGWSEQHAYRLLDAASIRAELATHIDVSTPNLTEKVNNLEASKPTHLLELKPLPPPARLEVASRVDFSATSVRELRQIVKEAKAALETKLVEARASQPARAPREATILPESIHLDVADASRLPLPDECIDLIVTSPPYGLDKDYFVEPDRSEDVNWRLKLQGWLREMFRVARPNGRLAINVPLDTTRGGFRPTYAQTVFLADLAGWRYRSSIVWAEGNVSKSTARGSVDSPSAPHVIAPVEMIALFSKGDWRREPSGHVADLTHEEWLEWTNGLWTFGGESRAWEGHPAPFPPELPRRLIKLLSFPGDTVLDPFLGSGTTALVACQLGRRCYGFDLSAEYVASAKRRLTEAIL